MMHLAYRGYCGAQAESCFKTGLHRGIWDGRIHDQIIREAFRSYIKDLQLLEYARH